MEDPTEGLTRLGEPLLQHLPRAAKAPRVVELTFWYDPDDPARWLVQVRRGGDVVGRVGPLAPEPFADIVTASEVQKILDVKGPNLDRVAGFGELRYQQKPGGRLWLRSEVEALAARRAEDGRLAAAKRKREAQAG